MGALISKNHLEKVLQYVKVGIENGAELLIGGKKIDYIDDICKGGYYMEPTVLLVPSAEENNARVSGREAGNYQKKNPIVVDEIFGPVMTIIPFKDESNVIKQANETDYGLAAGIFTNDLRRAHRVVQCLEAGTVWINNYNLAPVEAPFGGFKQSGIGKENGTECMESYLQTKSIYVELDEIGSFF